MLTQKILLIVFLFKLTNLLGQIPVHEEPLHRPVFQNKEIRILNVLLPPGDTTQYHIHEKPSLFIFFTNTTTGSQLQGREALTGKSTAGGILFENLAPPNIRTHRVWNADKDTFHVMDVELLFNETRFVHNVLTLPKLELEINTTWVRAYRLTLLKDDGFTLKNEKHPYILISLNTPLVETKPNGKTQYQTLKQGGFFNIQRRHSFFIKNKSDNVAQFILLELPTQ